MPATPKSRAKSALSPPEKVLFKRISADLKRRGTLDQVPVELLLDYVHLDTRIADLRGMAAEIDDPKVKLGAYRQLEAAVTQRRQLANCLFPQAEVGKKTLRQLAANADDVDQGWAKLLPT